MQALQKEVNKMTVAQILGYVNQLLTDWGVMPYIQVGLVLLAVMTAIAYLRRIGVGS